MSTCPTVCRCWNAILCSPSSRAPIFLKKTKNKDFSFFYPCLSAKEMLFLSIIPASNGTDICFVFMQVVWKKLTQTRFYWDIGLYNPAITENVGMGNAKRLKRLKRPNLLWLLRYSTSCGCCYLTSIWLLKKWNVSPWRHVQQQTL